MSRRYWLPILAVVGLTLSVDAQEANKRQGGQPSTAQTQAAPQAKPQPTVPLALHNSVDGIRAAIEAASNKAETPEEKRRADEDLEAQKQMAESAQWAVIIGIAGTVITLAGVLLILATLIYTKRAAEAASAAVIEAKRAADAGAEAVLVTRQIGEAQVRAYLSCLDSPMLIMEGHFTCWVKFKNSGQSPASKVRVEADLRFNQGWLLDTRLEWKEKTSTLPPIEAGGTASGGIIIYGEDVKAPAGAFLSEEGHFSLEGGVYWEDVFGKEHCMAFSLTQLGPSPLKGRNGHSYREGTLAARNRTPITLEEWEREEAIWAAEQEAENQGDPGKA